MMIVFLHFAAVFSVLMLVVWGAGVGEGIIARAAIEAINIQPQAKNDINRALILGLALVETAAVLGAITAGLMLKTGMEPVVSELYTYLAELGMAIAVGISGFLVAIFSAKPAQQACLAIARQPLMAQKILRLMLIAQSLIQTPVIFGLIVAVLILNGAPYVSSWSESMKLLAAGVSIGIGGVGPIIGLGTFSSQACRSVGVNRRMYTKLLTFTFVSIAIIETPSIFAMVVSFLILTTPVSAATWYDGVRLLCAAFAMGLGTLGAGISSGRTAAQACHQAGLHEEQFTSISRTSMVAQGLIDTCAIYPLLGALALIFA